MPQERAPQALRQRVQTMAVAHRARPRSRLTCLVDFLVLNRTPLLGVASAAAFVVAFFLLLIKPSPADVLGRTLDGQVYRAGAPVVEPA